MWEANYESLPGRVKISLSGMDGELRYGETLQRWSSDPTFRAFFRERLAQLPFDAYRWETPPVTAETLERPFECMAIDAPSLARPADTRSFAEHFERESAASVLTFSNLGGDAVMVVPRPLVSPESYVHIGVFTREAPESQQDALWKAVGQAMFRRVGHRPVWLSTAGGGVAWLHVRLDDRPKYYAHGPYRRES